MEISVVTDLTLPSGTGVLTVAGDTDTLALVVAGTAAEPQIMDLLNLPLGARIAVTTYLGDQVLQDRVYVGEAKPVTLPSGVAGAGVDGVSDDPTVAGLMPESIEIRADVVRPE